MLFHAASAGDVQAVAPVAVALVKARPSWQVVCSVQTRSGWRTAERLIGPLGGVAASPLDCWPWTDRFIRRLRPDVLVLEYLELWPSLMRCVRAGGGEVFLQNARLHPARRRHYHRGLGGAFYRGVIGQLSGASARTKADAEALHRLCAFDVSVHPHTKHATLLAPEEVEVRALAAKRGLTQWPRGQTWIAGSLHADEIDTVLEAQSRLMRQGEAVQLVICPRYLEIAPMIVKRAARMGLGVRRERPEGRRGPPDASIVVVETVGELRTLYAMAAVAFVGGTLGRRGGQNPLEPAIAGCHLIVGPNTVQIEAELGWLSGVVVVEDGASLAESVTAGFASPLVERGAAAREVVALAGDAARMLAARIVERAEAAHQRRGSSALR